MIPRILRYSETGEEIKDEEVNDREGEGVNRSGGGGGGCDGGGDGTRTWTKGMESSHLTQSDYNEALGKNHTILTVLFCLPNPFSLLPHSAAAATTTATPADDNDEEEEEEGE